ncbi:MAG TPA: type I glutamate--ammonia ligase [Aggregatilineaceae bacterium]|jgi:glutamine synthetase|nr:type I glutamate--ammonia ligase [Anaerolineae bacterium]HMM28789.1 type I glutamate--ammonia ligase [Aggregatilineaceae bacterium]
MDDKTRAIIETTKREEVKFIDLQFTDIFGVTKSVTLPAERLEEAIERGIWFDGSSIQGFARIQESDMYLQPDPVTFRILPWTRNNGTSDLRARVLCDVHGPDGEPFEADPRFALKRAIQHAEKLGFVYNTGPELEFFLFRETNGEQRAVPHDVGGYFDFSPEDEAQRVRSDIVKALLALRIHVEMSHHEVAVGQHEIDFRYEPALHSADNAITFKYTVKGLAAKHGLFATFMPKPIFGINGSGMHVHQSLMDIETGTNLFYDADGEYKLSKLARHFIAGQLEHARGMAAIVAPTVNSYKRLTPGYEAPVYVCWAQRNRSAMIRVPRYSPGREQSTRVELRFPDPSCNPYLAFAVMLEAGLDGIERELEPPDAVTDDVFHWTQAQREACGVHTLPGTLEEALDELAKDALLRQALGEHIYGVYDRARRAEWEEYRIHVTAWESERYLYTL